MNNAPFIRANAPATLPSCATQPRCGLITITKKTTKTSVEVAKASLQHPLGRSTASEADSSKTLEREAPICSLAAVKAPRMTKCRIYSTQAGPAEENPAEHVPVPVRRNIHLVRVFAAAAFRRARDGICGDIPPPLALALALAMTRLLGENKAPQKRNQRDRRATLLSVQGQNEEKRRLFFLLLFLSLFFFPLF